MTDLHSQLKAKTSTIHSKIEDLPFMKALMENKLHRTALLGYMHSLAVVHVVVELCLKDSLDSIGNLWNPKMNKSKFLLDDLKELKINISTINPIAVQNTINLANEILANAADPNSMIGVLYVLEGSQNGNIHLKKMFANCLGLAPDNLKYFGCYGSESADVWKDFTHKLNSMNVTSSESLALMNSAVEIFKGIYKILSSLWPFPEEEEKPFDAGAVNSEAGNHSITNDPEEIGIALYAGNQAWKEFKYLDFRFKERGRKFTTSDSCWLISLIHESPESGLKSLNWLRKVLSTRGLPTIILEKHLKFIQVEMTQRKLNGFGFDLFLQRLDSERTKLFGSLSNNEKYNEFEKRFNRCSGLSIPKSTQLLTSAWQDQQSGIDGAMDSTLSWLMDPKRFTDEWISIINEFVIELKKVK